MPNTFDWIEIRTHDIAKASRFYAGVFGWQVIASDVADGTTVQIVDTGAEPRAQNLRRGGLWLKPPSEPAGVIVYIVVENIEATLRKVTESGCKIVEPKLPQGSAYRACFADPDGNRLGLWQEMDLR